MKGTEQREAGNRIEKEGGNKCKRGQTDKKQGKKATRRDKEKTSRRIEGGNKDIPQNGKRRFKKAAKITKKKKTYLKGRTVAEKVQHGCLC